jgi:dTDP-4-amino-4,6-dideoxygalactose transaminase
MGVPFLDVGAATNELRAEIDDAISRVLSSGWYVLGHELELFEAEWAAHVGASQCVGVGSGLDALRLALMAMGIGPGDEVIVPSNTYIATWLAVSEVGATPVPVEPLASTYNLDPDRVEAALTPRTRAILPVHLYGQPADMPSLWRLAAERDLWLLDDAAQAHGARLNGRRVGALGHLTAWSFYPGKNLGALGDAGAITTDDAVLAERVRLLRNYGSPVKYTHQVRGLNSRLDEVQAAVLRAKLPHLDEWTERRRAVAASYLAGLADLPLVLPTTPDWAEPVWHLFVVRNASRDALAAKLAEAGVATLIHYPIPPHRQGAYEDLAIPQGTLPVSEAIHREVLSLPMGPHLGEEQANFVIQATRDALLATVGG